MYRSGYGWALIRWSNRPLDYADARLAFCFLGAWLSMAITFGYLSRGGVWLGAFSAALPLIPCLILVDTVPEETWIFLQLFSLLLLLFCSKDPKRGFYVSLPVALVLGLMFLLMPQETYKGQDAAERAWSWLEEKFTEADPEGTIAAPDMQTQQVNLSNAGPRPRWMIPAMNVTAQETGALYLRSLAFDGYTGSRWTLDENDSQFPLFSSGGRLQTLKVETLALHDTLYLPYGAQSVYQGPYVLEDVVEGQLDNTFQATTYDIFYKTPNLSLVSQYASGLGAISGIDGSILVAIPETETGLVIQMETAWSRYLALPEETRARAQAWLDSHIPADTGSKWETAQLICDLVSQSARYDLSTQRMPIGEDFAMWFLEESETGYCVHYASAAAVLLRAAGIPSRYVSGFVVNAVAGEQVTVYQKNSHAWVEVFIEGCGWVMLEPTPGEGVENTLSDSTPTEATTAPTETTQPSESTEAPETTAPTRPDPTAPSQTTPIGGADAPQNPGASQQKKPLPNWVKGLLWIPVALIALWGQWKLRRQLRKRWQREGNLNRQVLKLWREAALLGKILGQKPPEEFFQLAQKAKFSQYALTPQERLQAAHHLESLRKQLRTAPLWRKAIGFLLALI
jgi:transglutaminase-like putative cysteine protease